jgi:methionyl-tRNA formyltransferase
MTVAVVFAYHDVGVRCLNVLLSQDVDVRLVVTHDDNPEENIWFESVEKLALEREIPVIKPVDANAADIVARIRATKPDFLFSFYYRSMLRRALLGVPKRGALNMHGSLLPKYRGRVPINWAIIHGETETGATLHHMAVKPDAGEIVDQEAVPILPDDTALDVFRSVTAAAERCLTRALPMLINGTSESIVQDLTQGSYFGGRTAADGVINWMQTAEQIHNLVRAVAPPYPGATSKAGSFALRILRTRREPHKPMPTGRPTLFAEKELLLAAAGDGNVLRILELEVDGVFIPPSQLAEKLHGAPLPLG